METTPLQINGVGTRYPSADPSGANDAHATRKELEALRVENCRLAEAVAQAQAAEDRRKALVSMLVHDLRSPAQGLRLILDFLVVEGDGLSADARKTCLSEAITATRMMARLLDTVLDIGQFENGVLVIKNGAGADAQTLFREALFSLGGLVRNRPVDLVFPSAAVSLWGDHEMLVRLIANLLAYVLNRTPEGVVIRAGASCDGDSCSLWVDDPRPDAALLQWAETAAGSSTDDRGLQSVRGQDLHVLGLAFCRLAAEAHRGFFSVTPHDGGGNRLLASLPVHANREP